MKAHDRTKTIGGSDSGGIANMSPYDTALDVWLYKTGRTEGPELNDGMEWGLRLEQPVGVKYADEHGVEIWKPEPEVIHHPDIEFITGSPDFLIRGERGGLEVKTSSSHAASQWSETIPEFYWTQAVWYMELMNHAGRETDYWDFAVLIGGRDYREFRIERTKSVIEAGKWLYELADKFWNNNVLKDIPPEIDIDGTDRCTKALKALYPDNTLDHIEAPEHSIAMIYDLQNLKDWKKVVKYKHDEAANRLSKVIGTASGLTLADGGRVDWKKNADGKKTDWESISEELGVTRELIKKHTKVTKGNRPLSLRLKKQDQIQGGTA